MKHQRDTAIAVYRDLQPSLQRREQIVLDALKAWRGPAPTSYELTQALQERGQAFDLNSVRPRLCSLQDKALVRTGDKRRCQVSGKTVYTWAVCAPPRVAREPEPQWLTF